MKKILILGGGLAQLGLIKTAKVIGLEVIVVGIKGNYPGYQFADKVYFEDIYDKSAVLAVAQKEAIDGICMVCSDYALSTLGYVNDKMKLTGLSEKCAEDSSDKMKMKQLLLSNGVPTPSFAFVKDDNDVTRAIETLSFPMIVKAVDLQGSRGIYICKDASELKQNYVKSISESRHDYCIVEEFIEGEEFGAQAFIQNGEVLFVIAHGDQIKKSAERNIPIGHYLPLYAPEDSRNVEIKGIVEKAIHAMGFDNCAVNVDLIEKDGKAYIIELTGRAGANSLPEIMSEYLGVNYYEMVLRNALGESIDAYVNGGKPKEPCCVMSRQLFSLKSGIVKEIKYSNTDQLSEFTLFIKEGSEVHAFNNSVDCIGRVVYKGKDKEDCDKYLEKFIGSIEIVFQ